MRLKSLRAAVAASAVAVVCLLPLRAAAQVPLGWVQVSASNTMDNGVNIANGTISFAPVSNTGRPLGFRIGSSSGGQHGPDPFQATVTNGVFTIQVPDSSLTYPVNVCYSVTVTDNASGNTLTGTGYGCVQPSGSGTAVTGGTGIAWCTAAGVSGGTCNFDIYPPSTPALVVEQPGPTGPQGPAGLPNDPNCKPDGSGTLNCVTVAANAVRSSSPLLPGLNAFGDSICALTGPSSSSLAFVSRVMAVLGGTLNNLCVPGSSILNDPTMYFASSLPLPTASGNPTVIEQGGKNDATSCLTDPTCYAHPMLALQTIIGWLGSSNVVPSSQAIESGVWADSSSVPRCRQTTTNNSIQKYTITTYGSSAIGVSVGSLNATASVTIDGASVAGFTSYNSYILTNMYPVSAGNHTVVVTDTAATNPANVLTVCGVVAGNNPANAGAVGAPRVWVMEVIPYQGGYNADGITLLNTIKLATTQSMAAWGYNATWAPTWSLGQAATTTANGGIGAQGATAVTAWSITSNVPTFTSTNGFQVGATLQLSAFGTSTFFNGKVGTVTAASSSSFTLSIPNFSVANSSATEAGTATGVDSEGMVCAGTTTDHTHPNDCGHKQLANELLYDLNPLTGGANTPAACASVHKVASYTLTAADCIVTMDGGTTLTLPSLSNNGPYYINNDTTGTVTLVGMWTAGGQITSIPAHSGAILYQYTINWLAIPGGSSTTAAGCTSSVHKTTSYTLTNADCMVTMDGNTLTLPTLSNLGPYYIANDLGGTLTLSGSIQSGQPTSIPPNGGATIFEYGSSWLVIASPALTYTVSWTPIAATTSQCAEQTLSTGLSGFVSSRPLIVTPPSSMGAHLWIGSTRVGSVNSATVSFCADSTGGTPPSGNWLFRQ
jgi:hypothetical protein